MRVRKFKALQSHARKRKHFQRIFHRLELSKIHNFSERSYGSEVEHSLGKGEVAGSSPAMSSIFSQRL